MGLARRERAMDAEELSVEVRQESGHVYVRVSGELDVATVPHLRERLDMLAGSGQPLIVDLDRVTFLDATGLGVLARAASQAAQHGNSVHVVSAWHQIRRLFVITGLDHHIPLARTKTDALHNLAAAREIPFSYHGQREGLPSPSARPGAAFRDSASPGKSNKP